MFGIGSTELIVILIVALIVIGPAKLPEMAKSLGKALGEFRRVSTDVKRTIEMEAEQADQKVRTEQAKKELFPDVAAADAPADKGPANTEQPVQAASELAAQAGQSEQSGQAEQSGQSMKAKA
jgi:sec-independent protein translocase protein TatB